MSSSPARLDAALWRAVAVYRAAAWLYAAGSMAVYRDTYQRPALGLVVLALMAGWTGLSAWLYGRFRSTVWLLVVDLAIAVAAVLSSLLVLTPERIAAGDPTVPVSWSAAPVLAWAVAFGWPGGLFAGVTVAAAAFVERGALAQATVNSAVLLVLVGVIVGYVVMLARRAELAFARAVELQTVAAERERLSRQVHDGVLQVLALVSRRSADRQLAVLAAEQERSLRRLITTGPEPVPAGEEDLRGLLPSGPDVEVSSPASPVLLPAPVARELAAAVGAAVDNVRQHAGTTAWLLVEDEPDCVTVTVRDAGPGIPAGRLEQAAREGRLGVASSIRGRVSELGGTVSVVSEPGEGTEVELRVPR